MASEQLLAAYLRRLETRQDEDFWAWEQVEDLIRHDPGQGFETVCELIERTTSDRALADIAAGPLESLVRQHGHVVIDRIEEESRRNARFRLALSGLWIQPGDPIYARWLALITKHGFTDGSRKGL